MKAKVICLLFGFGAGARKKEAKEAKIPPLPFSLPQNGREEVLPTPVTLTGTGKMLAFENEFISTTFKSKGSLYAYDIYFRDPRQFMQAFPPGNRILKIQVEQGMINEDIYKSIRCTSPAKKKLEFRTNFQDIVWPSEEFGRMYILEIYERKTTPVKKPRKKKTPPIPPAEEKENPPSA